MSNMSHQNSLRRLRAVAPNSEIRCDEPLADHTTLRIGGPAKFWIEVSNQDELIALVSVCAEEELSLLVIGGGSNLLCSDEGRAGVVLHLSGEGFTQISLDEETRTLSVGAGCNTRTLVERSLDAGFVSLVDLAGIPGTVGGALAVNAGTHGTGIADFVSEVEGITFEGEPRHLTRDDFSYGYRNCSLGKGFVITRITLAPLEKGDVDSARALMAERQLARRASQPLDQANAGSIFRNPEGAHAGALIEGCDMKGTCCGGACVSELHANFIVNSGGAHSWQVRALMADIEKKVNAEYGIQLTPEIRIIEAR